MTESLIKPHDRMEKFGQEDVSPGSNSSFKPTWMMGE